MINRLKAYILSWFTQDDDYDLVEWAQDITGDRE